MRIALSFVVVLGAACGDDPAPTATFSVSWSLTDPAAVSAPTCDSYKLADVVVTATETSTGDTHMVSAPCTAGMVATPKLGLGSYKVELAAMGTFGDEAGKKELTGMLVTKDQVVTLAPAMITVAAPTAKSHAVWTLEKNGTASGCGAIQNQGVEITTTPMGQSPQLDIWDCTELNTVIDIPYGPHTVQGRLLGAANTPIAVSAEVPADAGRGVITVQVAFEVP